MASDSDPTFGDQNDYPDNPFAAPQAYDQPSAMEPARTGDLELNPWVSIWTKPRVTIRQIVDSDPKHRIPVLAAIGGIGSVLGNFATVAEGDLSMGIFLAFAFVLGPVVGFLMLYLYGAILGLCCRALGGTAQGPDMRAAIAWGWVPMLVLIPVNLIAAVALSQPGAVDGGDAGAMLALFAVVQMIFSYWSFFILLGTVAEVNLFSRWKAFGAMLLPAVVISAIAMIGLIILGATGGMAP